MQKTNTLFDHLVRHRETDAAIHEVETGLTRTFAEVADNALRRARVLAGYEGDIVCVVLPNSIDYIECFMASLVASKWFSPVPYFTSENELEKVLGYIRPAVLVTDRGGIAERFGASVPVVGREIPDGPQFQPIPLDPDSPAALYYSSGTTGNPKGVLYSHRNMVSLIGSIVRGFGFGPGDRMFTFLPFGHTASINYNILPALMCGCDLFISQGFEQLRADFFATLARHAITYTQVVPTVLHMLMKLKPDVSGLSLDRLRYIGCGSSTLSLSLQKAFIDHFGIRVANLYGLSETGPSHIDDPSAQGWEPGSVGFPLDVNRCRLAEDGEILLKGDNVFMGYYQNPDLYAEVVRDGWFHTGDLGREENGRFFYEDRKKDLIIKGGINITPAEVEDVLFKSDSVLECVVVGKRSDLLGEEIVAVVVPKTAVADGRALVAELKTLCKEHLSNYKVPTRIEIWEEIPKTKSGKLMRRKVRQVINA